MRTRRRRSWSLPSALLGAVVLGVATLYQPKTDSRQHWSIPPTFPVGEQAPEQGLPQPLR